MENIDHFFDLLTKHWKIIVLIGSFFVGGGYVIARYRTSGMRKMINAHSEVLDDLSDRLNKLRIDRENTRDQLSEERSKRFVSEDRVKELETRVAVLDARVKELEEEQENLRKIQN